jgi:hypothetical protein
MQTFGDQFLAGPSLADHQNGPVERSGTAGALDRVEKGQALPDELIGSFHPPISGVKSHQVARYFDHSLVENWRFLRIYVRSEFLAQTVQE